MRLLLTLVLGVAFAATLHAAPPEPVRLWPSDAPGALGSTEHDIPTLTPYLPAPDKATGTAIIVCPGGGYGSLAGYEGADYAEYLAQNGIAGFVLRYRLGTHGYHHPTMLQDAQRAIRTVRANAEKWQVNPKQVGIMGSSAGGHLAATACTHFDAGKADAEDLVERQGSRPDFGVMCYAVITMEDPLGKGGSRDNLLGTTPDPKLIEDLSAEKKVTKDTPPCFVWSTFDGDVGSAANALLFGQALQKAGVNYDLHIYQKGPHGIALSIGKNGAAPGEAHPWAKELLFWMRQNGWAKSL